VPDVSAGFDRACFEAEWVMTQQQIADEIDQLIFPAVAGFGKGSTVVNLLQAAYDQAKRQMEIEEQDVRDSQGQHGN